MPDIYQAIAENDAKIVATESKITAIENALNTHLSGDKGHVQSYKIGDREMVFNVTGFHKELERLNTELVKFKAESGRLAHLKAVYEGSGSSNRVYYRG